MSEGGNNFLNMVGYQHDRRCSATTRQPVDECQEMFARHRIKPGTGFIENTEPRTRHESPTDKDSLAFALGQYRPRPIGESRALHPCEDTARLGLFLSTRPAPIVDHGMPPTGHGVECRFRLGHHLAQRRADYAEPLPHITPVPMAVRITEQNNIPLGRHQVAGQRRKQGSFSGPIGSEDHPMLAGTNPP